MVQCKECGQLKESTQFSKCSSTRNGLQPKCKSCNKKDNLIFRTEKPEHHEKWQHNNLQRVCELVRKYRKADKTGKIYSITNKDGFVYVGMTKTPISVRILEHKSQYKRRHGIIPKLHESFDKFGFENHRIDILLELEEIDRKQLGFIESTFINLYQQKGKSLNIRTK
jgi:hypothetical protein